MPIYSLIISTFFVLSALQVNAAERPSLYNFAPAYPVELPELTKPLTRMPYFFREHIVRVNVEIDKKGRVGDIIAADSNKQNFADYAAQWIEAIPFEPSEVDGKPTVSALPLDLRFRPKVNYPEIVFPVNLDSSITNRDLYYASIEAHGVTLPSLKQFGKYFCTLKWTDSAGMYPYVLVEVSLDSSGYPVDVKNIQDEFPELVQQVMSGALWAEYRPMMTQSGAQATSCFVLVSFFPQMSYPAPVWDDSGSLSQADLMSARVQLIPDTVGLMQLPVCKITPASSFIVAGARKGLVDTISAVLSVDTTGDVSLYRVSPTKTPFRSAIRTLESKMKFYPARDFTGAPQYFSGLIKIIFDASETVRIEYSW